jgi:hypothetical protein
MKYMVLGALFLFLAATDVSALRQEPAKPAENEIKLEFFSGTVTEFSTTKVTVLREVIDRDSEERSFVINAETKIEGTLKGKVRVTVGYAVVEEAHVAVRIIVRAEQK